MRTLLHFSFFLIGLLSYLQLPASSTPEPIGEKESQAERDKIDLLNDHAWSLARSAPDSALYYAQEAIQRSQAIGNYGKGLINANTLLGILNKDRGYYELSVEHYLEAMQMAEAEGDCLRVSGCLNNLGVVAQVQGNHAKALVYFQRSLEIENEHGKDKEQRSIRLYNIGEAFEKLDSLDAAYAFYYNSLLIEEELENKVGIFYARLGIGKVDSKTGNGKKAGTELGKALALAEAIKDNQGICEVHNALGNLYIRESQFAAAKTSFEIALGKAREFKYPKLEVEALLGLYTMYREKGDFKSALEKQEQYYALKNELSSAEVSSRIGELQTRYEVEKREQEIELLKRKEEVRLQEMAAQRKLRNYLVFTVLLVVCLIAYNIWRERRMRSKYHGQKN